MDLIKQRFNSDSGESVSVSQLLWIMMAVIIVIGIGGFIYSVMKTKAQKTADCIDRANTYINGTAQNQGNRC